MKTDIRTRLVRLADSSLKIAQGSEDIRGREVVDKSLEEIGKVSELLVDEADNRVRFLEVRSGGFLGMGATEILLPIDAITSIDDDTVYIDQTRERIAQAPRYAPQLADDRYWEDVYSYYGYPPYWTAGYAYPAFPRRRGSRAKTE
jgi:sporulation protein YlmC with PRC-barrel domain